MSTIDLFEDERPMNSKRKQLRDEILAKLEFVHTSCACYCLDAKDDFIGFCFFHRDGKKVFNCNGKRVKSDYVFVTSPGNLTGRASLHQQAFERCFGDFKVNQRDTIILGFGQKNKKLHARSGTFNCDNTTSLLANKEKEGLFVFRMLAFGSLIVYKVSKLQNVSPTAATLAICLFLILKKRVGDRKVEDTFGICDLDIDHKEVILEEMARRYGIDDEIIQVACNYPELDSLSDKLKKELISRVESKTMDSLSQEISEVEFKVLVNAFGNIFFDLATFGLYSRLIRLAKLSKN